MSQPRIFFEESEYHRPLDQEITHQADFFVKRWSPAPSVRGSIRTSTIAFENVLLCRHAISVQGSLSIKSLMKGNATRILYLSEGTWSGLLTSRSGKYTVDTGHHNIFFDKNGFEERITIQSGKNTAIIFEVYLAPVFFDRLLTQQVIRQYKLPGYNDKGQKSSFMFKESLPLTPKMEDRIQNILHCKKGKPLKRLSIESDIIELLMLQIEQMCQYEQAESASFLSEEDIEKLHAAYRHISEHFMNPPTLSKLSKYIHLNEYKLKKGFKEFFGTTVYGHITDIKMNRAKELLLSGSRNVSEVAYEIGYKNPQHFTAAFKKYFNALPSDFKNR